MTDIFLLLLLVLNNIVWMIFVFIFTADKKKQTIKLPKVKVKLPQIGSKQEDKPEDFDDLTTGSVSARDVLKSMEQ